MNKLSKLAFIAATAVMAASAMAQSVPASRQAVNDNWVNGTGDRWTSAGIVSDGSYGVPEGIVSSFPVRSVRSRASRECCRDQPARRWRASSA